MLREVTPLASDDAARLDATETNHSDHHLPEVGAELQEASPEVRAAAVLRSQRLPKPEVMLDAWRSLPGSLQDQIGTAALTHSFYSRESQEDPCGLTLEAGVWAERLETQALNDVETIAKAALPELYGRDGEEPAWATSDAPLSFPNPLAFIPTKLPPRARAEAVARARRIPGLDNILAAWTRLPPDAQDRLGVQAIAFALYGWLTDDRQREPADRWLTDAAVSRQQGKADRALNLLDDIARRSLPELFGTKKRDPAWARVAEDAEEALGTLWEAAQPSPLQFAVAVHCRSWQTLQASNALLDAIDRPDRKKVMWPAEDAESEAEDDVMLVACRDLKDAAALLTHLRWYLEVRPQRPIRPELNPRTTDLIAARMADLSFMLGEAGWRAGGGDLAATLAEHRRAWSTYLATPDPEVTGWDVHHALTGAVDAAVSAVLAMPCANLADGAALVSHAQWYSAELEAAGEDLTDGFTYEVQHLRARAGDWAMFLGAGSRLA